MEGSTLVLCNPSEENLDRRSGRRGSMRRTILVLTMLVFQPAVAQKIHLRRRRGGALDLELGSCRAATGDSVDALGVASLDNQDMGDHFRRRATFLKRAPVFSCERRSGSHLLGPNALKNLKLLVDRGGCRNQSESGPTALTCTSSGVSGRR